MKKVDLVLHRFSRAIRRIYGDRLKKIILFGSRARGEFNKYSDVDLVVVLDVMGDFWAEMDRIQPISNQLSLEYELIITAFPIKEEELETRRLPFYMNIRKEGVVVGPGYGRALAKIKRKS